MSDDPTFLTVEYEDALGSALDFRGFRLPALALDQMLNAASQFTDRSKDPVAPLDAVSITVADDVLTVTATDRYSVIVETRTVNQSGADATFLLELDDLRTVRSVLRAGIGQAAKADKPVLPVDVMLGDTGFLEIVLGERRVMCSPRDVPEGTDFPKTADMVARTEALLDGGLDPLDVALNAELLVRLRPLQKAGYGVFRMQRGARPGGNGPVIFRPLIAHGENADYERDVTVLVMPIRPPEDPSAQSAAPEAVETPTAGQS